MGYAQRLNLRHGLWMGLRHGGRLGLRHGERLGLRLDLRVELDVRQVHRPLGVRIRRAV